MTNSLSLLFAAINASPSELNLRSQVAPQIGEYFAAKRQAIFFFNQLPCQNRTLQPILNLALSTTHNPVARYLAERHSPVHEALVSTPKAWSLICPRPDHWHVMAGPIIHYGQIVGIVGCTREQAMPAFDHDNLVDLSAICLHLSARVAVVSTIENWAQRLQHPSLGCESRSDSQNDHSRNVRQQSGLTARELQIAELVALGQTNAEIGQQLWITENSVKQALKRMFRKLQVSSRAEMVAKLLQARR